MDKSFVETIDFAEIKLHEVLGKGAFGVVRRASWRNIDVAVKVIETETERRAFSTEIKQLSRVNHPNIVKLYGACNQPVVCLVMEYAEGGSLYNVLHREDRPVSYTLAHAISWVLQCAKGVDYLHGMKPKPLIHRDLKPPNLLLIAGGTILKICDFGTACDAHTYMTNNKGSAAWMAPEVFEGSTYSEKCDVFSWGIILWEVLTRRKPFDEIGGAAFKIMWAVHMGTRPPRISNCPKVIDELMTKCWDPKPVKRPSISEVVRVMSRIATFIKGADQPLQYQSESPEMQYAPSFSFSSSYKGQQDTVLSSGEPVPLFHQPKHQPVVVEEVDYHRQQSAPASLAASKENLLEKGSRSSTPSIDVTPKRFSADLSGELYQPTPLTHEQKKQLHGHRRSGSHGSNTSFNFEPLPYGSYPGESRIHHSTTAPGELSVIQNTTRQANVPVNDETHTAWQFAVSAMDHQLQPLLPARSNDDSVKLYNDHCKMLQDYLRVQTDIYILRQRKYDLLQEKVRDDLESPVTEIPLADDYKAQHSEHVALLKWYDVLQKEVENKHQSQQVSCA